jgi:N-acetylglucosaminyl-diphospho-decaprenol L-rhamnosyltransferase
MHSPPITIVCVNYRTPQLACVCVDSVAQERAAGLDLRMVVVDNGSGDDSAQRLHAHVDARGYDWVEIVTSEVNAGYAAGNNLALARVLADDPACEYIWLLNPDTRLRAGAGRALLDFIQSRGVDIVGSRLEDEDGTPQYSSFNFPSCLSELCDGARLGVLDRALAHFRVIRPLSEQPEACGWLAGASVMLTRRVFEAAGLLDADYFLYFEEVDFFLAARKAGYPCWYVPESRVFHAVGASTGISEHRSVAPRRPQYWFDSRRRYFRKNHGRVYAAAADLCFLCGYLSWRVRSRFTHPARVAEEPPHFLVDFIRNSVLGRSLPGSG